MAKSRAASVDPALLPLIKALAEMVVADQARETAEAAGELAALRAALQLQDDPVTWKRKAEGLMRAYYRHVPDALRLPLKCRVRLVLMAVTELGRTTSYKRIALRAAELEAAQRDAAHVAPRRTPRRSFQSGRSKGNLSP